MNRLIRVASLFVRPRVVSQVVKVPTTFGFLRPMQMSIRSFADMGGMETEGEVGLKFEC